MTKPSRRWFALLPACLLVAGLCGACGTGDAATVGNVPITRASLTRELNAIAANADYMSHLQQVAGFAFEDGRHRFLPVAVAQVLTTQIRQVAFKAIVAKHRAYKLTASETFDAKLDAMGRAGNEKIFGAFPRWYRDELLSRSVLPLALRRVFTSDLTLQQYYEKAKAEYARACEWDLVVKTRDAAAAARRRILSGESFQAVAREVSLDKGSGPQGGRLGCNEPNNLLPELDTVAFQLPLGAVSQPIASGTADARLYHLLLVTSRDTPPLATIKGEIQAALDKLGAARLQSALRAWIGAAKIRVAPDIGTWDEERQAVVPPVIGSATSPTPRPRPLPPVAKSSKDVSPFFQVGQQVFITDAGFKPRELVSIVDSKITFINETHEAQTIRFVSGGRLIGPIRPGGTASYTPDTTISILYTLSDKPDVEGNIQVQWYFDPGEDPGAPNRIGADTPAPSPANSAPAN